MKPVSVPTAQAASDFEGEARQLFRLKKVCHPSDFSAGNEVAFAHAVRIALSGRAELSILHVDEPSEETHSSDFPSVRSILARWGILPKGASREALKKTGLLIRKSQRIGHDPAKAIVRYVADHDPDLIVLATHQRQGLARWMNRAIAEPIARNAHAMSLFVPRRVMGFVSAESGAIRLENILVPIDRKPSPQSAVDAAVTLAVVLACPKVHFTFVYVGEETDRPAVEMPLQSGWTMANVTCAGDVVEQILLLSEQCNADLITMATDGPEGFLDALRGSTTERVLRGTKCPVLAIPAA